MRRSESHIRRSQALSKEFRCVVGLGASANTKQLAPAPTTTIRTDLLTDVVTVMLFTYAPYIGVGGIRNSVDLLPDIGEMHADGTPYS